MTMWLERPREEANLLNPAFCCLGLAGAVAGYQRAIPTGLPLPLAYMVLPIALHKPTRDLLPRDRRTSLPMWIQRNAKVRVLFYERLVSLKEFTNDAVLFGCRQHWLSMSGNASLTTTRGEAALRRAYATLEGEPEECARKALFLGKWFAAAGPSATVMALWGIQP